MIITTTMIHELILNDEELKAIETLESMLTEMQDRFGTVNFIQAIRTSEVVKGEEFARMRGVLEFLYTHRAIRVF